MLPCDTITTSILVESVEKFNKFDADLKDIKVRIGEFMISLNKTMDSLVSLMSVLFRVILSIIVSYEFIIPPIRKISLKRQGVCIKYSKT